jgi:GNAT superfamily N-acetyltransferase
MHKPNQQVLIQKMAETDIPGVCELRRLSGCDATPSKWRALLQLDPQGCFMAVHRERIVGTVTVITYVQELAWVGMLLVHPDFRRKGLGRRLMEQAMGYAKEVGIKRLRLDASPEGFPLYQKLGFVAEWTMTRWQGAPAIQSVETALIPFSVGDCTLRSSSSLSREPLIRPSGTFPPSDGGKERNAQFQTTSGIISGLRKLGHADLRAVRELDRVAFGVPRLDVLNRFARESIEALVWQPGGVLEGFGLLRPGASLDYLGPLLCTSVEGFRALATALLAKAQKSLVLWDIPDANAAANSVAREFGFEAVGNLTRMRLGPDGASSDPLAHYAIADPAVG